VKRLHALGPDLETARRFVECLRGPDAQWFQLIDDRKTGTGLDRKVYGTFDELAATFVDSAQRGAPPHVNINVCSPEGRTADHQLYPRCLCLDIDGSFELPGIVRSARPTMIVRTAHGSHVYWVLRDSFNVPLDLWQRAQRGLCLAASASLGKEVIDQLVTSLSRTQRIPGFHHCKDEPLMVEAKLIDPHNTFVFEELIERLETEAWLAEAERPPSLAPEDVESIDLQRRKDQCARYLAKVPGAVESRQAGAPSGSAWKGGYVLTRRVCGFGGDFGLEPLQYWPILKEWNLKCSPPWDEPALWDLLTAIHNRRTGEFGCRLREPQRPPEDPPWELDDDPFVDGGGRTTRSAPPPQAGSDSPPRRDAPSETPGLTAGDRAGLVRQAVALPAAQVPRAGGAGGGPPRGGDGPPSGGGGGGRGRGPGGPREPRRGDEDPMVPEPIFGRPGSTNGPDNIPLTHLGNAQRFAQRYGGVIRYVSALDTWFWWDGKRWAPDKDDEDDDAGLLDGAEGVRYGGKVWQAAFDLVRSFPDQNSRCRDEDMLRQWIKHWKKSESVEAITSMLKAARVLQGIAFAQASFDVDRDLLNTNSGIVNLQTGELFPHARSYYMTRLTRAEVVDAKAFDADMECPLWMNFLHEIMGGDREMVEFLQRLIGYGLTGYASEHIIAILYGTGRNGKSTFLGVLEDLAGEYAKSTDFSTFLEQNRSNVRNDLARLRKARIVTAVEPRENQRLDEAVVKSMTGDDRIVARFLFREYFEFRPQFLAIIAANHRPKIVGQDEGIWRRVCMIPFTHTIPKDKVIRNLREKLRAELPFIMRWAIRGANTWYEKGLMIPEKVSAASQSYRDAMDVIGQFLEESCDCEPVERLHLITPQVVKKSLVSSLYQAYKSFADDAGTRPWTRQRFVQALEDRGYERKRFANGVYIVGIGLLGHT